MGKQTKKWTMRDGSKICICDMSDSHLDNVVKMIERKAEAGVLFMDGWGDNIGTDFICDEYYLYGQDYLDKVRNYSELKSEQKRRTTCVSNYHS